MEKIAAKELRMTREEIELIRAQEDVARWSRLATLQAEILQFFMAEVRDIKSKVDGIQKYIEEMHEPFTPERVTASIKDVLE